MATGVSGFFDISGSKGFSVRVGYTETYDIATNKSSVAISYIYVKSSSYYTTYYLNGSVSIDGTTAFSMSSQAGSHSVTLSKLGTWYDINGNLGSVGNITHNDDGSRTVTISINVTGYTISGSTGSGNGWSVSGSKAVTLTTIARKSTLSASNGTLGTEQTLTISRYSSNFAHSIRYECGSVDTVVCTKVTGTSISFTPPLTLAKQNTIGTSVSITFTLYTFESTANDAKEIGRTTKTITCSIPSSVKPTCAISITDVSGHVSRFGAYVQGQSKLEVIVTPTTSYDSPIASYNVTADGKTYNYSDIEIAPIRGSGTLTISATVTDKRSRSGTDSETITVLPYTTPAISKLTVHRCDSDGTENQTGAYTKVTYSLAITSLNNVNTKIITLKYKKSSETSYASVTLPSVYSASSATYVFAADIDSSYDVTITAADTFAATSRSTSVSTAACFMDWDYENNSISFGKITEKSDAFDCAWPMYDQFNTSIGNGLAAYGGGGNNGIDPNTTLEELCLTSHENAPQGEGTFYFIYTAFYNAKSTTDARAQIAFPYNKRGSIYHRYYANGEWIEWNRYMRAIEVYPVNSIYISYSHTSPASLFGGTWTRIQSRFLWGTTTEGTIGATGGEQTHTLTVAEMPNHNHPVYLANIATSTAYGLSYTTSKGGEFSTEWGAGSKVGGGAAHNNMPPYVNVAIWRRTA